MQEKMPPFLLTLIKKIIIYYFLFLKYEETLISASCSFNLLRCNVFPIEEFSLIKRVSNLNPSKMN